MNRAAGAAGVLASKGFSVSNTVKADAAFLRRVFVALVFATAVTGGLAAFTTVQAMNASGQKACMFFCS
jgi:hypothetical protein